MGKIDKILFFLCAIPTVIYLDKMDEMLHYHFQFWER